MAVNGPRPGQAGSLAPDAAARHQCVALAPAPLVRDDLAAGRLVEILHTDIRPGACRPVASPDRWNMPAIARIRRRVQAAFAEDQ